MSSKFIKSTNPKKKYMIKHNNRWIHFGAKGYQHYHDKIGLYSNLDHNDKKRRANYRNRHSKIMTKDGQYAYKIKYSPAWYSWHYLW